MAGPSHAARPDWGLHEPPSSPLPGTRLLGLIAVPGVALAVVVGFLGGLLWGGLALVIFAAALVAVAVMQTGRVLGVHSARLVEPGSEPRLENLVAGLSADLGLSPPSVWVIPDGGPNALICPRGPQLALTRTLVDTYTRTELEAVVTHCLLRLRDGRLRGTAPALLLGSLAGGAAPYPGVHDDVAAAAVTRYPPALIAALHKAQPRGGRDAPLWFVAEGPGAPSPEQRLEALSDL